MKYFFSIIFLLVSSISQGSPVTDLIQSQSSVKNQGQVGSCSIFSAIGLLEHKLYKLGYTQGFSDLSEQWLLYATAGQKGSVGVTSSENITALNRYGFATESQWQFGPIPWDDLAGGGLMALLTNPIQYLKCQNLTNTEFYNGCLIGQKDPRLLEVDGELLNRFGSGFYDPKFLEMRNYADQWVGLINGFRVTDIQSVIRYLNNGTPLLADVNFFYEAWSHRRAPEFGLNRNMDYWYQGIISYPHPDSKDMSVHRSGHSIILVGHDPDIVIERQVMNKNNQPMTVRTKGVFYFKNSWGRDNFGREFNIEGESFPGYGMIPVDYIRHYGNVYGMTVNGK